MITIKLESYEDKKEYVAFYEISGYNMEENQDDYIANELPGWVTLINRYGKPDILILNNKIQIGVHSEYKNDVNFDYINYVLSEITGGNALTVKAIPCPALFKNDKYYLVDADEFLDKDELEERWLDGFQGWGDDDYPGTFKKFVNMAIKDGEVREVEFL